MSTPSIFETARRVIEDAQAQRAGGELSVSSVLVTDLELTLAAAIVAIEHQLAMPNPLAPPPADQGSQPPRSMESDGGASPQRCTKCDGGGVVLLSSGLCLRCHSHASLGVDANRGGER